MFHKFMCVVGSFRGLLKQEGSVQWRRNGNTGKETIITKERCKQ
jgi:hypothetical protein